MQLHLICESSSKLSSNFFIIFFVSDKLEKTALLLNLAVDEFFSMSTRKILSNMFKVNNKDNRMTSFSFSLNTDTLTGLNGCKSNSFFKKNTVSGFLVYTDVFNNPVKNFRWTFLWKYVTANPVSYFAKSFILDV